MLHNFICCTNLKILIFVCSYFFFLLLYVITDSFMKALNSLSYQVTCIMMYVNKIVLVHSFNLLKKVKECLILVLRLVNFGLIFIIFYYFFYLIFVFLIFTCISAGINSLSLYMVLSSHSTVAGCCLPA